MPFLMLKDLPRYECLLEAVRRYPELDPTACEAYLNLLRAGDEAYRKSETFFNSHGMTPGRFTVLMLLFDKLAGISLPQTPAELAEKAGVARATITGLVDTLERDGLVTRRHDPGDRRMMLIHLTPKGQAALDAILPGYFRQMADQMEPLTEHERKTLVRLLSKVAGRDQGAPAEARSHAEAGAV
jgi:DNA-binding MarR family transcriptional regulator